MKKLKKLLDDRPGHPDADAFRQRLPYLEVIAARNHENGDPIEAPLKPRFADPLIAGVGTKIYRRATLLPAGGSGTEAGGYLRKRKPLS